MKNKVLILGGCGYIGSRLYTLLSEMNYSVSSVDTEWFGNPAQIPNQKQDYNNLTESQIHSYDDIIVLAGHSSVQMCKNNWLSAYHNNVTNLVELLRKTHSGQRVFYASSSSVYGVYPDRLAPESALLARPVCEYDHTKQLCDQIVSDYFGRHPDHAEVWGLRFGTVCGASVNMRSDVMINAMTHSARSKGKVNVFNGDTRRSILGMNDLLRCYVTLLDRGKSGAIYNLASFHSDSVTIGHTVASQLGVPLVEDFPPATGNEKMITKNYDFWVDTTKFVQDYGFEFLETPESIVHSCDTAYINSVKSYRDREIQYGFRL